jgi:hypothetical protein
MFGGFTDSHSGYSNELITIDLVSQSFRQVYEPRLVPPPRYYHALTVVKLSIFLFGGLNQFTVALNDLWVGQLAYSGSGSVTDIIWSAPAISTSAAPSARVHHTLASSQGLIYLYGGASDPVATVIYGDFWSYTPVTRAWLLLTTIGNAPSARYSAAMDVLSQPFLNNLGYLSFQPVFYMFGGTTIGGTVSDMWRFTVKTSTWDQVLPAFPGAAWPFQRSLHSVAVLNTVASPGIISQISSWTSTYSTFASHRLSQYPDKLFPVSSDPVLSPSSYFLGLVNNSFFAANILMSKVKVGTPMSYFCVFGTHVSWSVLFFL